MTPPPAAVRTRARTRRIHERDPLSRRQGGHRHRRIQRHRARQSPRSSAGPGRTFTSRAAPLPPMEESRGRIEGVGGRGAVIELGVRDVRQVQELVARAVRDTGRLDIMVNNAGLSYPTPIVDGDPEEWLRHAGDERAGAPRRLPGRRPRDARLQGPGAHRQRLLHRRAAARFGRSTARPSTRSPASATRCAASWRRIRSASWTCARVRAPADALAGLDALALRWPPSPAQRSAMHPRPRTTGGIFMRRG